MAKQNPPKSKPKGKLVDTPVVKSLALKKDFSYSKGICSLNFTLNLNNTQNVLDFRSILVESLKDVNELLGISNSQSN